MASWIVHLRLAEELLGMIEGLDEEQFGIGSIAPDSGIPDENWENFDPPPEILHFRRGGPDDFTSSDLEFYRDHLKGFPWPGGDAEEFSFLLGYFFHLLTDNLWGEKFGKPTEELYESQYKAEYETMRDFFGEVKRDWYGQDFIYVRDHPGSFFWQTFLNSEIRSTYLDFLPQDALQQRMDYIKEFYQRMDEKVEKLYERRYMFLSKKEMDVFVQEGAKLLDRVWEMIWEEGVSVGLNETGLQLI